MNKSKVIYKHLWCWDRMMGSTFSWSANMQEIARQQGAPHDAVYCTGNTWHCYGDIKSGETKATIDRLMKLEFDIGE